MNRETEFKIFQKKPHYIKAMSTISKLNETIRNHRLNVREQILSKSLNFSILISILPFILGFNDFLKSRYFINQQKLLFQKNLPGLTYTSEKVSWDTFQQLADLPIADTQTFWNENNLLINNLTQTKRFLTSTQNYKSSIFNLDKNQIFYIYYNQPNQINVFDCIPFRLQSKSNTIQNSITNNIEINKIYELDSFISKTNDLNVQNLILQEQNNSKRLIGIYSLKTKINERTTSKNVTLKKYYLLREFQNIVDELNLIPNIDFSAIFQKFEKIDVESIINDSDFVQIKKFIEIVDKEKLNSNFFLTRLMSGYINPDQSLFKLTKNFTKKNKLRSQVIEIDLPFSFLNSNNFDITTKKPPNIVLQTGLLNFDENSPFQVLYNGPGVLMDVETGFDWKFNSTSNQESIREIIFEHLGQINPITNKLSNFFGVFHSPESSSYFLNKNYSNNFSYWLNNLFIFRTGSFINPINTDFNFQSLVQFPYFSNSNINTSSTSLLTLPILQTRLIQSTTQNIKSPLSNFKQFEFSIPIKSTKNYLNFVGNISTYLSNEYNSDYLISGIYKSRPSIFTSNIKETFFTNLWEPITFKSWLITSQIGFGFLIFRTLKALADNYGRELLVYLLDLVALLGFVDDDLKQEIEILMGQKEKGFRIIEKTTQNFSQIGGIKNILPDIIEIVWFLRNSGRNFSLSKIIPRGVLLTGPPGTGKTLLVQAIAGEAEVPVIALSGSSLLEPGESGALKLELLFQEARQISPCIVFIDEIDTLAQKREQVLQNPMGADEILETFKPTNNYEIKTEYSGSDIGQQEMNKEKLRILMQFLVELDGIQGRSGVIVIGATNRPEVLDPAILRPGRFDKIIELGLPGPEKRKEILKLYSKNLGIDNQISWDYVVDRTIGYSAADLAGIMNQSTLAAVLQNTNHTIETIEFGIDRITTIGFEESKKIKTQNTYIRQLAYYQAGKFLITFLLKNHPDSLITYLWPRRSNIRALQIQKNLQSYFFKYAQRCELEDRVIGCYGGKAAEVLFLQTLHNNTNLSDLGLEDIQFAQNLIETMMNTWYLYGKEISIQKETQLCENFNKKEYFNEIEKAEFLETSSITFDKNFDIQSNSFISSIDSSETENLVRQQAQNFFDTSVWQSQIANEFEFSTRIFTEWYRLYLPDPQQLEQNLEWIPPDEYHLNNSVLSPLTSFINWNEISEITSNYQSSSLILQSYNTALRLLDFNREFLDIFVCKLLKDEILRKPEIEYLFKQEFNSIKSKQNKTSDLKTKQVVYQSWGSKSRRKLSRYIPSDFI